MERKIKRKNKRKGPDQVAKTVSLIIAVSWILLFVLLMILALAKPSAEMSIFSIAAQNTPSVVGGWDLSFMQILPPVLITQLGLCLFGLLLSSRRMKRKNDKYSYSLIFFTATSVIGLAVYLIFLV